MNEIVVEFWYWWVIAVGFLAIELLVPGFFFLWLSVSAFIVGSVLLMIPAAPFEVQLLLFSLMAVTSIMVWRRYVSAKAQERDHPLLNQRGAQYLGQTFNVVVPIENGQGKIKVGDSHWLVRGQDCPAGSKVKVVAVKGTVFEVEACE